MFCDSHPRGVDRCDMRAGIGAGREICQTAGDMRAERAECGKARLNRDSPSRRRPLLPIRWEDAPGLGRSRGGLAAGREICAPMARGGIWEIRT